MLRRGCGCALFVLVGLGLLAAFGWWRAASAPEIWEEQDALLKTRTESERRELARRVEDRLLRASRPPSPSPAGPGSEVPAFGEGEALDAGGPSSGQESSTSSEDPRSAAPRRDRSAPVSPSSGRRREDASEDGARRVTLPMTELNALLQERVARWEARRKGSPLPVKNPVLAIEDDHLVLFVQLHNRGSEMLLGLPVDVAIDGGGGVARLLGVRLGQLPLPGLEALPRLLRSTGDPGLTELAEKAEGATGGYPFDPVLESEDGDPLRFVDLEVDSSQQALHLTLGD